MLSKLHRSPLLWLVMNSSSVLEWQRGAWHAWMGRGRWVEESIHRKTLSEKVFIFRIIDFEESFLSWAGATIYCISPWYLILLLVRKFIESLRVLKCCERQPQKLHFGYGIAASNQVLETATSASATYRCHPGFVRFLEVRDLGSVDVIEHCCFESMGYFLQPTWWEARAS